MVEFALQSQDPADAARAEAAGFVAFLVADHPGTGVSPFVTLAHAAAGTTTISLGTYVVNVGVREPLHIAADVATLDLLSGGRALLGIGAGHTPAEWRMIGRTAMSAPERVTRLIESVEVIRRVLAGETVTFHGEHIHADGAALAQPRAVPLLIGGGNTRLLQYAGEHADIVGISGLGRTLADGHTHEVRWHTDDVDRTIAHVRAAGRTPVIDALVQHVEITTDRTAAAEKLTHEIPQFTAADLLACPYVLIGTEDQLVAEVRSHHDRWGIDRFTVRASALDAIAPLIST